MKSFMSNYGTAFLLFGFLLACSGREIKLETKQSKPDFCNSGQELVVKSYHPPYSPKYFFKPAGLQGEIAFVGEDEKTTRDQNYLYELASGKLTPIPGRLDPMGLYQTDLLSVPLDDDKGGLRLAFFDVRELRKNSLRTKPLLPPDQSLSGRYQSMGVLQRSGSKVKFRVITDGHLGGEFRDYEVNFSHVPATLRPLTPVRLLCKNLRDQGSGILKLKLPMISKDATYLSAFDLNEQKMRVFQLGQNGSCIETVRNLLNRGDSGKFDFSEDAKQVAFHYSDRSLDLTPLEFGVPESSWQLRGAVYDFENDTYQLLPFFGKGTNLYYPAFLPNGNVLALKTDGQSYDFLEVNLAKAKRLSRASLEAYANLSDLEFSGIQKITERWMNVCLDSDLFGIRTHRLLSFFSFSKEQCLGLAALDHVEKTCDLLTHHK